MDDNSKRRAVPPSSARLIPDKEMAPQIGVSVAYLQRDRREGQRIPFVRIGDRCLYDPNEVFEAIKSYRVGGPRRPRKVAA
jgi:hypothetical protein